MKKWIVIIHAFLLLFAFSACSKDVVIVVDDVDAICNASFFGGIRPDIYYSDLVEIAGEPNEYTDMKKGDEVSHNPTYYFSEGKVMCYWSGSRRAPIGTVIFTPYQNTHIQLNSVIQSSLGDYGISAKTKKVRVYEGDTLYYVFYLKQLEIKEAFFLLYTNKRS